MPEGSAAGAAVSVLVYIIFQICGLACSCSALRNRAASLRVLSGSVLGSVLFQWLPVLYAFIVGFTLAAHLLALATAVLLGAGAWIKGRLSLGSLGGLKRPGAVVLITAGVAYAVFCFLAVHSFRMVEGAVHSSQCTYGDMSMHLGFITSIAGQGTFPPDYSILPGTRLSYPFLSDSVSSSLLIFGAPLRFAYLFPMLVAGAQAVGGVVLLMGAWLQNKWKSAVAVALFFLNGGLGFAYFMPQPDNAENFTRIFSAFYQTPTNYLDGNIRWVNVIVDMLVPQRATLFGWAVLFAALCLLFSALQEEQDRPCLIFAGILGGALPMIHTHSFLALGLVSAGWLITEMIGKGFPRFNWRVIKGVLIAFPFAMALLQLCLMGEKNAGWLLYVAIAALLMAFFGVTALFVCKKDLRAMIPGWGLYLLIVLFLALPQLLMWTFRQARGEVFVRGYFNWANGADSYLWFYLKNIGVLAALYIPAVLFAKKRMLKAVFPLLLIMLLSELVVFQPNEYDNNKLIYIAYLLACGLTTDFLVEALCRVKPAGLRGAAASAVLFFCVISAVLTIGREAVADYVLFSREHTETAAYIASNTGPGAVFLTDNRHNNSVAALTGRNIVCGSGSYLYFHGLDYDQREEDVKRMYESPSQALFEKYGVDYIEISDYERSSYAVDEGYFTSRYPLVYENGPVRIYQVKAG